MDPFLFRVGSLVAVALLAALVSVVLSARHIRSLRAHRSPGVGALVEQAERAAGAKEPVEVVLGELSEAVANADRALQLATMLPRALARVSLASGTALGILSLVAAGSAGLGSVAAGVAAFFVGAVGSGVCAMFGREAREEARTARAKWRRDFRGAVEALGAEVEWTSGRRAR
jgi:hypothetical protein